MGSYGSGVDVTRRHGAPDWSAVRAAGHGFVYVEATAGVGPPSPWLDTQLAGARGAGMLTGLLHRAATGVDAAEQEAAAFATHLARLDSARIGNLPPCLSVGETASGLPERVRGFVEALRGHTGRRTAVLHGTGAVLAGLGIERWADPEVVLWVADPGSPPGAPRHRTDRVVVHQYAQDGRVDGIDAPVPLDVALTSLPRLTGDPGFTGGPLPQAGASAAGGSAAEQHRYEVQPGDTLSGIGARLGVDWQEIARLNGVTDPDLIYVGEVLRIP